MGTEAIQRTAQRLLAEQARAEAAEAALGAAYEALTADDLSPLVTREAVENARIILAEALIEVAPKGKSHE